MEVALEKAKIKGINQGIGQGINQGAKEKQLKIAKKMKAEGLAIALISRVTELSKEEIDNL